MEVLPFILSLIAIPNFLYAVLFIFSYRGIHKVFQGNTKGEYFNVAIAAILLSGPTYYFATFVYSKNRLVARGWMLVYSFALFMFIGFLF